MPGEAYADAASIGRVANRRDQRGLKVGFQVFERAVQECCRLFPEHPIRIGAQQYLEGFYNQFGFVKQGEPYLEDGIVHITMERASGG
jgi:ElaA protein